MKLWRFIAARYLSPLKSAVRPAASELRTVPDAETPDYLVGVPPLEHDLALLAEQSEYRTLTTAEQRRLERGIRRACARVLQARLRRDGKA